MIEHGYCITLEGDRVEYYRSQVTGFAGELEDLRIHLDSRLTDARLHNDYDYKKINAILKDPSGIYNVYGRVSHQLDGRCTESAKSRLDYLRTLGIEDGLIKEDEYVYLVKVDTERKDKDIGIIMGKIKDREVKIDKIKGELKCVDLGIFTDVPDIYPPSVVK